MIKTIPAQAERKFFVCDNCKCEDHVSGAVYDAWRPPSGWSVLSYETDRKDHTWGQDPREEPKANVHEPVHLCKDCVKKLVREKRWV